MPFSLIRKIMKITVLAVVDIKKWQQGFLLPLLIILW